MVNLKIPLDFRILLAIKIASEFCKKLSFHVKTYHFHRKSEKSEEMIEYSVEIVYYSICVEIIALLTDN